MSVRLLALIPLLLVGACATPNMGWLPDGPSEKTSSARIVTADVVAINQPLIYNRFGSMNPWGMIYALRDDLDDAAAPAGQARLRQDQRPRPLVLRVSQGDELRIRFQNLLAPAQRIDGKVQCGLRLETEPVVERPEAEAPEGMETTSFTVPDPPNDPCTRRAGIAIVGLTPIAGSDSAATGLTSPEPGGTPITYRYRADKEGAYFFSSLAAIAGGEGDGGSLTHGLFGMVIVEPRDSRYYRSQVSKADLDCARDQAAGGPGCRSKRGAAWLDYEATRDGKPLLNMLRRNSDGTYAIVHGDLTAIVVSENAGVVGQPASPEARLGSAAWREFAIMFHDELKTVHHPDFAVLNGPEGDASAVDKARHQQMVGTRDGFGINYGASGMGTILLANRAGKGPARDCVDCAYEEFFLASWANGDPALLADYADDPSNVYHSYLGDRVKFYNVHAGPKETHVFHLHAHQWLSQQTGPKLPDGTMPPPSKGNYLDSQSIAPFQTFSYEIYYGGTGNRNLTPGDAIFHCHLYPHFAQGMWALWRVHEVLEDGARRLPDVGGAWGFQDGKGWRYDATAYAGPGTDKQTGAHGAGTPVPGLVPMPGQAMPPEPTYAKSPPVRLADGSVAPVMPGYPFYIAGKAGYRAPQAPRDLAEDAGLPRHVTEKPEDCPDGINGCARILPTLADALDDGDMTFDIRKVKLSILPQDGDSFERAAMNWHAGRPAGADPYSQTLPTNWFHTSRLVDRYYDGVSAPFLVNGLEAAAGAPYANPCPMRPGVADHWVRGLPSLATRERRYDVSAIELDLVVNQYGWHDKQARINVLDSDVGDYEKKRRAADPFFFRANSGECIVFEHTNRTPGHTRKDAFQVATPTDIIGQHIHLVKFDVTSSDGSANGYNYEDGTLARDHIETMIAASKAPGGSAVMSDTGAPTVLNAKRAGGKPVYQSSIQRWWADPLLDGERQDRTIATVFTHDHFAPSTIQQHGFYSALLIEPAGKRADGSPWASTWKKPDGSPLTSGVGTQAIIEVPRDVTDVTPNLRGSRREFALAVADFALLYDRHDKPIAPPHGDPTRPEAISVDHHDPYVFNYKNEPVPLRTGRTSDGWEQLPGAHGNLANLFDSTVHATNPNSRPDAATVDLRKNHAPGDPSTEIFEAYDGDTVQVRLVQGAQEVQHNFTVHGQKWRRQSADPKSTWVSSQEIGISEHFEMEMQLQRTPIGDPARLTSDFLYHAGTVDAIWNGAWGFFRSYAEPSLTRDVASGAGGVPIRCRLAVLDAPMAAVADPACRGRVPATAVSAAPLITGFTGLGTGNAFRAPNASGRLFCIEAVAEPLAYNAASRISDPNAMRFVLREAYRLTAEEMNNPPACPRPGSPVQLRAARIPLPADDKRPLVLRVKSGEMAIINVTNSLPATLPRTQGNAELPPIVSARPNMSLNDTLVPSSTVGLHAGLMSYIVRQSDGARVGLNGTSTPALASRGLTTTSVWYAGTVEYARQDTTIPVRFVPFETERGMVATLSSMADPIRHPAGGLVGALVIEPADVDLDGAHAAGSIRDGGTTARLCREGRGKDCWDEFVLVYQDGLNLKQEEAGAQSTIPDCHVCDDSYDSGDIALNYRTEPFWARLGLPRVDSNPDPEVGDKPVRVDLNKFEIPDGFLQPKFKAVETPTFCTKPGEHVIVHAVHPGGRARQRGFVTLGLRYDDLGMPRFGSPNSALLGPQKAETMDLGRVADGLWLYRDGPAFIMASGSWGYIDARAQKPDGACAGIP